MSSSELFLGNEEVDPIDMVESLAQNNAWEFDRVADDQIAMAIQGVWRTYSLTLAWSQQDETLRLICTFEMDPPAEAMGRIYEILNLANDEIWTGGFTFWDAQKLMTYRYGLALDGGAELGAEQVSRLLSAAVSCCERFYPAFQLVAWGDQSPSKALGIAMTEAYGHA
jgi:hypothetical protein